jgi:hypothetical protein
VPISHACRRREAQQLLCQQQQYLNRPKLTDCRYQGAFLNCTTY